MSQIYTPQKEVVVVLKSNAQKNIKVFGTEYFRKSKNYEVYLNLLRTFFENDFFRKNQEVDILNCPKYMSKTDFHRRFQQRTAYSLINSLFMYVPCLEFLSSLRDRTKVFLLEVFSISLILEFFKQTKFKFNPSVIISQKFDCKLVIHFPHHTFSHITSTFDNHHSNLTENIFS